MIEVFRVAERCIFSLDWLHPPTCSAECTGSYSGPILLYECPLLGIVLVLGGFSVDVKSFAFCCPYVGLPNWPSLLVIEAILCEERDVLFHVDSFVSHSTYFGPGVCISLIFFTVLHV